MASANPHFRPIDGSAPTIRFPGAPLGPSPPGGAPPAQPGWFRSHLGWLVAFALVAWLLARDFLPDAPNPGPAPDSNAVAAGKAFAPRTAQGARDRPTRGSFDR